MNDKNEKKMIEVIPIDDGDQTKEYEVWMNRSVNERWMNTIKWNKQQFNMKWTGIEFEGVCATTSTACPASNRQQGVNDNR